MQRRTLTILGLITSQGSNISTDGNILLNDGDRDIIDGDYIYISSDDNRFELSKRRHDDDG